MSNWAATPTRYDRGARGRYPDRGYCKSLFASKNIKKTNYASSKRCARTPQRAAVAVYVFCFLHGRASWAVRFLDDGFVPCYREIFNVILRYGGFCRRTSVGGITENIKYGVSCLTRICTQYCTHFSAVQMVGSAVVQIFYRPPVFR